MSNECLDCTIRVTTPDGDIVNVFADLTYEGGDDVCAKAREAFAEAFGAGDPSVLAFDDDPDAFKFEIVEVDHFDASAFDTLAKINDLAEAVSRVNACAGFDLATFAELVSDHGFSPDGHGARAAVDAYVGCFASKVDYLDEIGALDDLPDQFKSYLDYDSYADDMLVDCTVIDAGGRSFHVFTA